MCSSAGIFASGVLLVLPTFLSADVGSSLPSLLVSAIDCLHIVACTFSFANVLECRRWQQFAQSTCFNRGSRRAC